MLRVPGSFFSSRLIIAFCAAAMSLSVASAAHAQGKKKPAAKVDPKAEEEKRNKAREAYKLGTTAFEIGDYTTAVENFKKAYEILPSPHAQFWIAQSLDNAGKGDEAISAYEKLLADPEVSKIGPEKEDTAKKRLDALKNPKPAEAAADKPAEPPPEEKPAEAPPPVEEPPPAEATPPPESTSPTPDLKPKAGLIELGLFTGPLFIAGGHNLMEMKFPRREYNSPAWLVGLRMAYFPAKALGIEAEYAHGWGSVKGPVTVTTSGPTEDGAEFNTVRGHLIGQLGSWRLVPFALLGAGVLQATSDRLGADGDFILEVGAGAKFAVSKVFTPRLDLRFDLSQAEGGGFGDGITVHPELLLGASFTFGR